MIIEAFDPRSAVRILSAEYTSIHTGDDKGFMRCPCSCCKSPLHGNRHELWGLVPKDREGAERGYTRRGGMSAIYIGEACDDCFNVINS